ncbi:hypothetical protein SDC9_187691 [bioreactor metagenome]|uniref:Uncharacterized protein n=1 Tax=bioreactor metagenome TaxID=1076179 RepID=A0A645HM79_9ZZZZ
MGKRYPILVWSLGVMPVKCVPIFGIQMEIISG